MTASKKTYNLYDIGSPDGHKDHVTHYMICIYAVLDSLKYQGNEKLCILGRNSLKTWITATKLWFSRLKLATNEVFLGYLHENGRIREEYFSKKCEFLHENKTFLMWAISYKKWADLNNKWANLEI